MMAGAEREINEAARFGSMTWRNPGLLETDPLTGGPAPYDPDGGGPETHPCLEIGGVRVYAYFEDRILHVALHCNGAVPAVTSPEGDVPTRITVGGTLICAAISPGLAAAEPAGVPAGTDLGDLDVPVGIDLDLAMDTARLIRASRGSRAARPGEQPGRAGGTMRVEVSYPDGTAARWALPENDPRLDDLERILGTPDTMLA